MKKLWILSILALGVVGAACNSGDPAPTQGDADITKDMSKDQAAPPAAAARGEGAGKPGVMTPPPP